MNETGNQYALAALKDKRATLAGEIVTLKRKIAWAEKQLEHVDACLTIFDPNVKLGAIGVKRPRVRVKLFRQGELGRLIIDALRRAGKPQGLRDITTALLTAGGHGEPARPSLTPRVRGNLSYQVKRGALRSIGAGRTITWALYSAN